MTNTLSSFLTAVNSCPLVPVLTIEDADTAGELATVLYDAGLTTAEVTLRTDCALAAIKAMKSAAPNLVVGAGTILNKDDVLASLDAGSDFLVTPATSKRLRKVLQKVSVPVFPGVSTPSEALTLYEHGFEYLKFFPAESNGGVKALRSIGAPMPQIKFMPTGGIDAGSAPEYLACLNVIAIGGSWMIDKVANKNRDWETLSLAIKEAVSGI